MGDAMVCGSDRRLIGVALVAMLSMAPQAKAQDETPPDDREAESAQGVATILVGPDGASTRSSLAQALAADARVVLTDAELTDAAVSGSRAADGTLDVPALTSALGARLVIEVHVEGRGARRAVVLVARDATGAELATTRIVGVAAGSAGRGALRDAMGPLLEHALAALAPEAPPEPEAPPPPPAPAPAPAPEPAPAPAVEEAPFGEDPALVTAMLGVVVRSRDAETVLADGTGHGYSTDAYVELHARIETRPLAHDRGYARGLYAYAEYANAVSLSSQGAGATNVSTQFFRLGVHAGYLVPVGPWLEAGASVGFGWDAYLVSTNPVYPYVEYPYLRPGVRARIRCLGEMLVADVEAGYRAILARDGLNAAFGAAGDSAGFDVGAGVSGTFAFGLAYGVSFAWVQYSHAFSQGGAIGNGDHGTDGGYRLTFSIGYGLR